MQAPLRHPNIVVDASVWVSILLPLDSNHSRSLAWWRLFTASGGSLIAPELLLVEVAAAVARQTKAPTDAASAVSYLRQSGNMQLMPVDSTLLLDAADLAGRFSFKGADAIYVAAAHQKALPLLSWDKEQLGRAMILPDRFTPDTVPF